MQTGEEHVGVYYVASITDVSRETDKRTWDEFRFA